MIALPARNNAIAGGLLALEKILPRKFARVLGGFRAARVKIPAPAILKILRRKSQKAHGKFFRGFGMKLRRMRERNLTGLCGHRAADFRHAVSDADHRGLAGGVQIAAAIRVKNPASFAAHSDRILLTEIPGKQRCRMRGRTHTGIVAEGPKAAAVPWICECIKLAAQACGSAAGCGTLSRVRRYSLEAVLILSLHPFFSFVGCFRARPILRADNSAAGSAYRRFARCAVEQFSGETGAARKTRTVDSVLSEVDSGRAFAARVDCRSGRIEAFRRRQGNSLAARRRRYVRVPH